MVKHPYQLTIKEKILACYPNLITESIHKVVGCSSVYVNVILAEENLKYIK